MEHYELLAVVSAKVSDEEIDSILEKIKAEIRAEKGEITLAKNLGKKKFSYPIAQMRYGYYVLLEFNADQGAIKLLDKKLSQEGIIVRHQIIKVREKTAEEIKKLEQEKLVRLAEARTPAPASAVVAPVYAAKKVTPTVPKEEFAPATPAKKPVLSTVDSLAEAAPSQTQEKEDKKKKITLEELDEKLDKILEDDIMNE